MITKNYNPSPLEVKIVEVLHELREEINAKLDGFSITGVESNKNLDNPIIEFYLQDNDGDAHDLILKIIQKPDKTEF